MKERVLKKLSMYRVKILKQETLLQHYIDGGREYHDDTSKIKTRLYCYSFEVEQLKRQLIESKQLV